MKDICAIYLKEDKAIIKKLVSKLESDGISCWVPPRDFNQDNIEDVKKVIEKSNILLLALNNNTSKNKQIINILEEALENDLEIIPFVTGKVDSDLYSEYFFYQFSWVDAYEDEFDEAYEVLLEAIDELSDETPKRTLPKKKSNANNINNRWYIAIAAVLLIVIGYFAFDYFSESKIVKEKKKTLIGEWHLSNYTDNLRRTSQDSINHFRQIEMMKKTVALIFKEDKSFERRGFTKEPQIGTWKIGDNAKKLILLPLGSKIENILDIEKFTNNQLIFAINEKVATTKGDSIKVQTKLIFTK